MIQKVKRQLKKIHWFLNNHNRIIKLEHDAKKIKIVEKIPDHFLGPVTYNTDSLYTSNNCDFITEPRFAKAYAKAQETKPWEGFTLQWRVYSICWFADLAKNLEGDYVECGVNTGAYSRAILDYISFEKLDKTFYLLDTFEGFPIDQISEDEIKAGVSVYETHYHDVYEEVKNTFKNFNVKIIKGRVPETLAECTTEKIAFLSIDMNAVAPEIAAMNYFWNKVVNGGIVVLDDYGFPLHIQQKLAFDQFAKEHKQDILTLPTGQGIIIKK